MRLRRERLPVASVASAAVPGERCPWGPKACDAAARGGHVGCLMYLHSEGCPWYPRACWLAAIGGHVAAAGASHLGVLKYLREHSPSPRWFS